MIRTSIKQTLRFDWRLTNELKAMRLWVLKHGIRMMCGSSVTIDPAAFADFPLVNAGLRLALLRSLRFFGIREIVSRSGLGYPFLCRIGDLSEHPFYHRNAYQKELELCAAWLRETGATCVYDIGANDGFFSCQLAQMAGSEPLKIYSFEPVPTTFAGLVASVQKLGMQGKVYPISAAVTDHLGPIQMTYSPRNSLCAQVTPKGLNGRVGDTLAYAVGLTLDKFAAFSGSMPSLLKIDVEGSEPAVLRGAHSLLSRAARPALLFEYNPLTLAECGESSESLAQLLTGYTLHYVDDLETQKLPFGAAIGALSDIHWICNIFAVPADGDAALRWHTALAAALSRVNV